MDVTPVLQRMASNMVAADVDFWKQGNKDLNCKTFAIEQSVESHDGELFVELKVSWSRGPNKMTLTEVFGPVEKPYTDDELGVITWGLRLWINKEEEKLWESA